MTLIELLIASVVLVIVMAGVSNMFVSGLRAGTNANARLASQESVGNAFDRLEYETRCASSASLLSSGGGVELSLPSQCPHATGTVVWCVSGGVLERITGSTNCSAGTPQPYVSDVTSATPFACLTASGDLPRLQVTLTVNTSTTNPADATTAVDTITLRNATPGSGCS